MAANALLIKVAALTATAALAGTVAFLAARPATADPTPARSWIDDPLDGSIVPPAPLGILAHAYDPSGVAQLTLLVNGQEDQVVAPERAGQRLVFAQLSWVPPGPGSYLLAVVGHSAAGGHGAPGQAVVVVSAGPPDVPAPTVAGTPTAAPTPSTQAPPPPTTTGPPPPATRPPPPCTPPVPIPLQPEEGATIRSPGPHAPTFTWAAWRGTRPACPPTGFRVEVRYGRNVVEADTSAAVTTWQPAPLPCGSTYSWRVAAKRTDESLTDWSPTRTLVIVCIPT